MRVCPACEKAKDDSEFYTYGHQLSEDCGECIDAMWRAANPDLVESKAVVKNIRMGDRRSGKLAAQTKYEERKRHEGLSSVSGG